MHRRLKHNPDFNRLKQGGRGALGHSSYWLGKDHLLVVETVNYIERYRRFYFRDIQALVIQQSQARLWTNFALWCPGLLALTFIIWAMVNESLSGWQEVGGIVAISVGGPIAVALLWAGLVNSLRGPTCVVQVRTAVQEQRLRGVTRWRKAGELAATLTPLLRAAQAAGTASEPSAAPALAPEAGLPQPAPDDEPTAPPVTA